MKIQYFASVQSYLCSCIIIGKRNNTTKKSNFSITLGTLSPKLLSEHQIRSI